MSRKKRVTSKTSAPAPAYDPVQAERDREGAKRHLNTHLLFWSVCSGKACQRARACRGDPYACNDRWWPLVPEAVKVEFRVGIKAMADGLTVQEAMAAAKAEAARWREIEAHIGGHETVAPAPAAAPADVADARPHPGDAAHAPIAPRVRIT